MRPSWAAWSCSRGSEDQTLKVWDQESERLLSTLEDHTDRVMACAVTPTAGA